MEKLNLKFPINSFGMGQVSVNLLKEIYRRGFEPALFPIGVVDTKAYKLDSDFKNWLQRSIANRHKSFSKKAPMIEFSHISRQSYGENVFAEKNFLLTSHKLDQATDTEIKVCSNYFDKVFFSSSFSQKIFSNFGAKNTDVFLTPYDEELFKAKKRRASSVKSFCVVGKIEKRKQTIRVIKLWLEKFADNFDYSLTCLIDNPFLKEENMKQAKEYIVTTKIDDSPRENIPLNISFLPHLAYNYQVNDLLASHDHCISMGTEGWGLPAFYSCVLGNKPIVLNAAGQKDWADERNSILVEPSSMLNAEDGIFFPKNSEYNQGNFFDFSDESFYAALDVALSTESVTVPNLLERFSPENCVEDLLSKVL